MTLTNKFNLPSPIVRAVENDPYSSGDSDLTTTQFTSPIQQVVLKKRYKDQIVEDVADKIWALLGSTASKDSVCHS